MNRIKLLDRLSGKSTWDIYNLFTKTQWYSEEEMRSFQLEKLVNLLLHCKQNIPYYSDFFSKKRIGTEDIKKIKNFDIIKELPVIDKEVIKKEYDRFIPINIKKISKVKWKQTSGTTGSILITRNDANSRGTTWGSFYRFYDWMGIKFEDLKLILMGGNIEREKITNIIKKHLIGFIENSRKFSPYEMTPYYKEKIIEYLNQNNVQLIHGYSQAIYELANFMKDKNLSRSLTAISTTAEPILSYQRDLFRQVFKCESFDQYGCGEVGGIAYECDSHNGLHITEEKVIIELDDNNDMLVTDLDIFALPFIRYKNGDQLIFSDENCSCGRKSQLIKQVLGRTCDYVIGNNVFKLHWAYFWHLLFDTKIALNKNMLKFQVHQNKNYEIKFKIISQPLTNEEKHVLIQHIREKLGNTPIHVTNVSDIPPSVSGKYRPVISELTN